jgi:hypothetical protein
MKARFCRAFFMRWHLEIQSSNLSGARLRQAQPAWGRNLFIICDQPSVFLRAENFFFKVFSKNKLH